MVTLLVITSNSVYFDIKIFYFHFSEIQSYLNIHALY